MTLMVCLQHVTKEFSAGKQTVRAVDDVSLEIERGEIFGVIGYSGAGKSTLVRLINALESPTSGTVIIDGETITGRTERQLRPVRARIGFIFQQFNLLGSRTVAGNIGYPLQVAHWSKERREARVTELLEFVGLSDKARQYPDQLSGGQKQRVGIARALATSPGLLLADEATSALDPETTRDVLDLLRRVNTELGVTIVVISHEMSVVSYLCDRVAVMEAGKVVEEGDVYTIFSSPRQPVTRRFIATALHDRPAADVVQRLRERHGGRIVTFGVRDGRGSGTFLSEQFRAHRVDGSIVYGGITDIGTRPLGSLTFELVGEEADVDQLLATMRSHTDVVEYGGPLRAADDAATNAGATDDDRVEVPR